MLILPKEQRYDCVQCAKGCLNNWTVDVDSKSAKLIAGSPVDLRIVEETGASGILGNEESGYRTRKTESGCVYLQDNLLCKIHAEVGYESKPLPCREFPFVFVETPDGVFVGVSFFCTSIQQNSGRPIEEHRESLQELFDQYGSRRPRVGFEPIQAGFERTMSWETYRQFELGLGSDLQSTSPQSAIGLNFFTVMQALSQSGPELTWTALQQARPRDGELYPLTVENPEIVTHIMFFGATLVGMMEADRPEDRSDVAQALLSDDEFTLAHTGWTGRYSELLPLLGNDRQELRDNWSRRYLQALIHRKVTILHRPLLHSLVLFYLIPWVLDFHAAVACTQRAASAIEIEDLRTALDKVEDSLVTHAGGYEAFFGFFAETFAQILSLQPSSN